MNKYTITGKILGDSDGKTVYLYSNFINSEGKGKDVPIASTTIVNNVFRFKGKLEHPQVLTIKIVKYSTVDTEVKGPIFQPVIPVFIGSGDVVITAELEHIPNELQLLTKSYSYKGINVEGSDCHSLYLSFYEGKKKFNDAKNREMMEYLIYLNPKEEEDRQSISKGVEIIRRIEQLENDYKSYIKQFISKNKSNVVAARIAFDKFSYFSVIEIDELLSTFSEHIMKSPVGELLLEKAADVQKTAVGAMFSDCVLEDADGNPVKLSSYLVKGKYVLLQFWASWCQACKADIPHLAAAYRLYGDSGFEILGISIDSNADEWLNAVDDYKMPWIQLCDLTGMKGVLSTKYKFSSVPMYILLDSDGYIISRNMRGLWLEKKLIELFGNKYL